MQSFAADSATYTAEQKAIVTELQHAWAKANYPVVVGGAAADAKNSDEQKENALKTLEEKSAAYAKKYPNSPEILIWDGIIKSTYAGAKGGLGALGFAKASKASLESALKINDQALEGSAYTSLGILYAKVPGWPIGFGDDKKAEKLLKKALAINPQGIDPNYFYADYLISQKKYDEAKKYLAAAQKAAPRPEREDADKGRQQDIKKALASLK